MSRRGMVLFGFYAVLASSRWLVALRFASSLPPAELLSIACFLVWVVALLPVREAGVAVRRGGWGGAGATALFAAAWSLSESGEVAIGAVTWSALLTLVPVVIVLAGAIVGAEEVDFLSLLGACVAGTGGVFLLLPANLDSVLRHPLELLAVMGGLGVGGWWVYRAGRELPWRVWVSLLLGPGVVLGAGFVALGGAGFRVPGRGDLLQIAWEAAEIGLLVVLLREVEPVALSSRFLLLPLLGVAEGYAVVRPELTWRMVVGVGLLLFGSVRLLRRGGVRDSRLSLF